MKSQISSLLSLAAFSFFFQLASSSPAVAVGSPVNTTSGLIIGHADPSYPGVSEYLGIPFALPPIADLRFAPPQAYHSNKHIVADTQPSSCPQSPTIRNTSQPQPQQNIDAEKASFTAHTSEDCLYLNIWTSSPSCEAKKPVLVWFYGGGFHAGGASDNTEQGGIFASEQDVVMVNFNYRVGIFGFSGAPGLTQNVGLLDQRLALEWVRDNIEAFGGDASRITIMGHSAGGASVDYYTYAWLEDPIIAGAVPMSGSATSFGHRTAQTGIEAWQSTSELLGCGNSSSPSNTDVLECMRKQGTQDLYTASLKGGAQVAKTLPKEHQVYVGVTGIYSPTIDNKTVFANYTTLADQKKFIPVPVLTGNNIDEACLFSQQGQFPVELDPLITETIFTCPVEHVAKFRAASSVPAWRYLWQAGYPNEDYPVCPGKPWHGSEVIVMFGSTWIASGEAATSKENADGLYFRKAMATFAGNPKAGLQTSLHWPGYDANPNQIVELAGNKTEMSVGNVLANNKICDTVFRDGGPNY